MRRKRYENDLTKEYFQLKVFESLQVVQLPLIQIIFHLIVLNKLELRFRRKSDRDTLILMMILISVAEPADPGL